MEELLQLLKRCRLPLEDEKATQLQLAFFLKANGVNFYKEHELDKKNIIDFYLPEIRTGIEIKIGHVSKKQMYKQVVRYCCFDDISAIVLLTNKIMGLPEIINEKPTAVVNLGKAWI